MKKVNYLFYANEDVWVYLADNVEIMKTMPANAIDLTVTSPPYDELRAYEGYSFNFKAVARQLYRITKQGGVVVWVVADATVDGSETGSSFKQALHFKRVGFNLHDTMIWKKPGFTATGSLAVRYAPVFEYMFVLSKGKPKTFNPIKDYYKKRIGWKKHGNVRQADGTFKPMSSPGKRLHNEYGQRHNVWNIQSEITGHPAPFPYKLARDHIISWSNEGDVVFDPFAGSGTTLKAAHALNRIAIGCDVSAEYCGMQVKRFTGEKEQEWENLLNGQ